VAILLVLLLAVQLLAAQPAPDHVMGTGMRH
jgi:hypothetical protein